MRRETYAATDPSEKEDSLKVRREAYAAIEPDAKNDLLERRRERAPVGQVCVSIVVFANRCASHSNLTFAHRRRVAPNVAYWP